MAEKVVPLTPVDAPSDEQTVRINTLFPLYPPIGQRGDVSRPCPQCGYLIWDETRPDYRIQPIACPQCQAWCANLAEAATEPPTQP